MGRSGVRPPAVAGSFHPGDADELTGVVDTLLERTRLRESKDAVGAVPVALVVPHVGYVDGDVLPVVSTGADPHRVVGYAAFALRPSTGSQPTATDPGRSSVDRTSRAG